MACRSTRYASRVGYTGNIQRYGQDAGTVVPGQDQAGSQCLSPTVGPDGFRRSHSPTHREALLTQSRNGGRKTAENFHAALEQWVERRRAKMVKVYEHALEGDQGDHRSAHG
jgi:hypothetical protein